MGKTVVKSTKQDKVSKKQKEQPKKRKAEEEAEEPTKKAKNNEGEAVAAGESTTCFIGNLSWNVDEDTLAAHFAEIGDVTSARIITDKNTGKAKGFGYVEFANAAAAKKAIALSGSELDGREIRVDISTPRPPRENNGKGRVEKPQSEPSNILFMGNLSFNVAEDELRTAFGQHGSILSMRFPTDKDTGAFKGFGYVEFNTVDEAKAAVAALNGQNFDGRAIRLDYSGQRNNAGGDRGRGNGRGNGRGARGGARGGRGGFGGRGGRGGFNSNRGGFKPAGTKIKFD
ncbi:hypothetical protein EDD86DRAFT_72531 [Gorgonomyces haynaldii]|nr:hypothetical protein EDD86DRAFT_72531 [Gorgonomyces haynaldii]